MIIDGWASATFASSSFRRASIYETQGFSHITSDFNNFI